MQPLSEISVRDQLVERRRGLELVSARVPKPELTRLLEEVDAALEKLVVGSFGVCEGCGAAVEGARLLHYPMARNCLACLTPREQAALERDLKLAGEVQGALLPKRHTRWRGWELHYHYQPLGVVSGDHCDLVARANTDERVFLVGDVSGKGIAASLLMSHLQALFRSLLELELPLDELVSRANRLFSRTTLASSFATLVVGRLTGEGEVELCNAGHCPVLLVQSQQVTPLTATGVPLGVTDDAVFELHRTRLDPEDMLFLFTDGLSEAPDGRNRQYGWQRLAPVLQRSLGAGARSTTEACLADLAAFRNGAPPTDDLTVMTIRRTDAL